MTHAPIPLSAPYMAPAIYDNVYKALASGKWSGDGSFCRQAEEKLHTIVGTPHVLLTTSCSHALDMSMILLDAEPGDEVILPSFTFTSTANAVLNAGLKPVFCEVDPATMNLDPADVARRTTAKTRAVIPIHYGGVACDLDALLPLCQEKGITLVEDAAQCLGAFWRGKPLGSLGAMGAFSFHDTKNIACGEGGALCLYDDNLALRASIMREKGTNRAQFLRGQVDKYTWVGRGSSYILAEPLAAILNAQLDVMGEIQSLRQRVYAFYQEALAPLAQKGVLLLPVIPAACQSNYHLFHLILPTAQERDALMAHLRTQGIAAAFHYLPLHTAPVGRSLGYNPGDFPITEDYAARLLRLPLYAGLTQEQTHRVVEAIQGFYRQ